MKLPHVKRRRLLLGGAALGLAACWPGVQLVAQQAHGFVVGPPVPDILPQRLSEHVWLIQARDGFPTPENQGMMANIIFVVTSVGVVMLDTGSSLQCGQMALRMVRRVSDKPVVAVFNTHFHGDHWLGNHAFEEAFGTKLPIYALPHTIEKVRGTEGNQWRSLMERATNQSTLGTRIVVPNTAVAHGQSFQFGDVTLRLHHYGHAHTLGDLSIEVVPDRVTAVGDIAMHQRIANMDDGSYRGTFAYYQKLAAAAGKQIWVPGHGQPGADLLESYGRFLQGIWEPCLRAVEQGLTEAEARAMVLKDPRVASQAATMQGFAGNIGKYVSLAYLEAEKVAF